MAEGGGVPESRPGSVSKRADDVKGLFDGPLRLAKTHREWSPTLVSAVN